MSCKTNRNWAGSEMDHNNSELYFAFLLFIIWVLRVISLRKQARQEALERQAALLKQSEMKDRPD